MKKSSWAVSVIASVVILFTGCNSLSSLPPIETARKSILRKGDFVFVGGHWKETECKGLKKMAKVNIVEITCDKNTMICTETFANVYAKGEDKTANVNLLNVGTIYYEIIEWTDENIIQAIYRAPVADIEIKISLKDNFAERSFRETQARGRDTASPDVYSHWVLE